jgi:hypothetical protein
MERDPKAVTNPERKAVVRPVLPQTLRPRAMSLEKAKKLIQKTSAEHESLFRRLAK